MRFAASLATYAAVNLRAFFARIGNLLGHPAGWENRPYNPLISGPYSLMEFQSRNAILLI